MVREEIVSLITVGDEILDNSLTKKILMKQREESEIVEYMRCLVVENMGC